jgi:6-oxo-cyclohex-1-ene-carbonyl-CoA hydrolase
MDLFNGMVDSILNCKKPVINRINGMRVAGGQEIGMACDVSISADTAVFGQAGPRHGSSPDGGATDFLPLYLSMEDAMWSCISCELWSAYKMKMKGLIHDTVPVLWAKDRDNYVPNPLVVTDKFIKDGEIVYGEFVSDQGAAKAWIKANTTIKLDALDTKIEETVWGLTNLFPGCLQKAIDSVRAKKKFWWDQAKLYNRHWLAANMMGEGYLGFTAFNERKQTGKDTINFVEYRRLLAEGHPMDQELIDAVLPPPNIEIMNKIAGELLKKPKESR